MTESKPSKLNQIVFDDEEYVKQSIDYCLDCGEDKHPDMTCAELKERTDLPEDTQMLNPSCEACGCCVKFVDEWICILDNQKECLDEDVMIDFNRDKAVEFLVEAELNVIADDQDQARHILMVGRKGLDNMKDSEVLEAYEEWIG